MIITSEQFNQAYEKLPYVLREYIAEDDLATVTEAVGKEYGLHVDTQGALYRETTNMLLGIINPTQFVGELKSVGIPEASIGPIVQELNEKIFMPLREKMKNQPEEPVQNDEEVESEPTPVAQPTVQPYEQIASAPVAAPVTYAQPAPVIPPVQIIPPAPVVVPPAPSYIPPAPVQSQRPSISEFAAPFAGTPQIPNPVSPPVPINLPTFTADMPVTQVATPAAPAVVQPATPAPITRTIPSGASTPHARTMEEDMKEAELQQQRNPNLYGIKPTQPAPVPVQSMPKPQQRAPSPMPSAPTPSPQSTTRDALHAVLKGYGIDPYREVPE